jgi:hypothetical protein
MADQQLNIKLNAIDNTQKAFSSVKGSIFSIKTALLTIVTSAVVKQITDVTKEFEQLRTTLRFVTGSIEGGRNAFNLLRDISKKTQFSTAELSNSFVTLQNSGLQPTEQLLMTFADTASVTANSLDTLNDLTRLFAKGATGAGIGAQSLSQLAGKGIPVFQILQKELGLSRDAIKSFAENADGSRIILDALERGLAKTFGGASSKRAEDLGNVIKLLFEDIKGLANLISTDGGFSKSFKELIKSFGELLKTLTPVILLMGKLLSVVADTAKAGFDVLNVTLQGTLNLLTKIGKATGFGSNLPKPDTSPTIGLDEDRTLAPPEIEDKSLIGLLEGKLKSEILLANVAFGNLNQTIADGTVAGVKNVSLAIAESIVLGKKLTDTFRELTQKLLVKILSQLIEEQLIKIALIALEQLKLFISKQQTAEIVKQNALLAQQQSIGGSKGGGLFGSLLKIGASFFGGATFDSAGINTTLTGTEGSFAEGGSVRGGMPITVGERGRELFVPNTNGTIIPNHDLGSGMNITFNIQANDVRGIKELLIDNRATIINLVNQGANQKGKSNIV